MDQRPTATVVPLHRQQAPASAFSVRSDVLRFTTSHALEFIDITDDVRRLVEATDIAYGQVTVFSAHTTAAVVLNEHEPLLLNDMARLLSRAAPPGDYYEHNDFSIRTVNMTDEECANGHAHCQHLFLGASETMPIHEGRIYIGRWQRLFLVELDHARQREVFVQALGMSTGG